MSAARLLPQPKAWTRHHLLTLTLAFADDERKEECGTVGDMIGLSCEGNVC